MILHAEDDEMVPATLGRKVLTKVGYMVLVTSLYLANLQLYEVAQKAHPGLVRLHLFPSRFRYNHMGIYHAPELLSYVA